MTYHAIDFDRYSIFTSILLLFVVWKKITFSWLWNFIFCLVKWKSKKLAKNWFLTGRLAVINNKRVPFWFLLPLLRPQIVPASRPLPPSILPPPVPLIGNWFFCHRARYSVLPNIICWNFICDIVILSFSRTNDRNCSYILIILWNTLKLALALHTNE